MSDEKVDKAKSALDAPGLPGATAESIEPGGGSKSRTAPPRPSAPRSVRPEVRADKFVGLPRPSVPLPPPSEPKTLVREEAVKLPPPPPMATSSSPPHAASAQPQQTEIAEPNDEAPPEIRRPPMTTSAPPAPPRAGFMAAVDRSKAHIDKARAALLAPALARSRAMFGKARSALRRPAVERFGALLDMARASIRAQAARMPGRRPEWSLAVIATISVLVGVGLLGFLFSLFRHRDHKELSISAARSAPVAASSSCAVAGPSRVIAPVAVVAAGVEARSLGESVAFGFAPADHEAVAVRLDPVSLTTTGNASDHSAEPIRRVRPVLAAKDTLGVALDVDAQGDRVRGRRTLPLDPPLQAGAVGSDIVWTRPGEPPAGKLWSLDGSEDLEALRGASEGSSGATKTAIAFRHGSSIWVGVATGDDALAPNGALSRIEGLGTTIGSPAVAIDEGVVMLAWADRPTSDVPWRLRIAQMKAGDPPGQPATFTPPPGGPGGHVMSPGLAALHGGRFLLVWTEGPTSHQRVRGITLTLSGQPIGKPLEISDERINSGQAQVAVTASGARGVVAFLEATEGGFEVAAIPLACGS